MPEGGRTTFQGFADAFIGVIDKPVSFFREKIVEPNRGEPLKYYHRKLNRVPNIDECEVDDPVCAFEANQQFKRDKLVDSEILDILRQRKMECLHFYGPDAKHRCQKVSQDYEDGETNWFIKYGDIGAAGTVQDAYMKQKHRLIWERRYGPVGTGMTKQE